MSRNDGTIQIDGATIMFKNFQGKETQFNPEGSRNFCVQLDPELAQELAAQGWNIKQTKVRDEGDIPQDYVQVRIKYRGRNGKEVRPPLVYMITSRGKTALDEDTIGILDMVDIANVDLIIRPYEWVMRGETGVTAYLKTIFVTIFEDALEERYREVPEIGARSAIGEIEAAGKDDDIQDADWYETDDHQKAIGSGR